MFQYLQLDTHTHNLSRLQETEKKMDNFLLLFGLISHVLSNRVFKKKAPYPTEPEKVKTHELNLTNNSENPPAEHYAHGEKCGMQPAV